MTDIVITEFMDEKIAGDGFAKHDLVYDPTLVDNPERLLKVVTNARALIVRNRTQVRGPLLEAARNLKVVGRLGVGLDNIDMDACLKRNIKVCPATGANDLCVAEYVITATLALMRGAWMASDQVAQGDWPRNKMIGMEVSGKILGLIGYGNIARETAKRAKSLGMSVIAFDPYLSSGDPRWDEIQSLSFDAIIETADIISLHTPLTGETKHLINAEAFTRMQNHTILINAARGGIVDESALADALYNRKLGGAALDVFENEPLTAEEGQKFLNCPNLLLTPHIAGVTQESNLRVSRVTVDNVLAALEA